MRPFERSILQLQSVLQSQEEPLAMAAAPLLAMVVFYLKHQSSVRLLRWLLDRLNDDSYQTQFACLLAIKRYVELEVPSANPPNTTPPQLQNPTHHTPFHPPSSSSSSAFSSPIGNSELPLRPPASQSNPPAQLSLIHVRVHSFLDRVSHPDCFSVAVSIEGLVGWHFPSLFTYRQFCDTADILIGWALDSDEAPFSAITSAFLSWDSLWATNLSFSKTLLSQFMTDMEHLVKQPSTSSSTDTQTSSSSPPLSSMSSNSSSSSSSSPSPSPSPSPLSTTSPTKSPSSSETSKEDQEEQQVIPKLIRYTSLLTCVICGLGSSHISCVYVAPREGNSILGRFLGVMMLANRANPSPPLIEQANSFLEAVIEISGRQLKDHFLFVLPFVLMQFSPQFDVVRALQLLLTMARCIGQLGLSALYADNMLFSNPILLLLRARPSHWRTRIPVSQLFVYFLESGAADAVMCTVEHLLEEIKYVRQLLTDRHVTSKSQSVSPEASTPKENFSRMHALFRMSQDDREYLVNESDDCLENLLMFNSLALHRYRPSLRICETVLNEIFNFLSPLHPFFMARPDLQISILRLLKITIDST